MIFKICSVCKMSIICFVMFYVASPMLKRLTLYFTKYLLFLKQTNKQKTPNLPNLPNSSTYQNICIRNDIILNFQAK